MRDYLQEYGIERYINAHDTITLYGASRMAESTLEAVRQVSGCFVDIMQMQRTLGERIAAMTHNEAAYIANCAAGALQLCAAVCMAGDSEAAYRRLPDTTGLRSEIIVLHAQHNCYDKAVEAAGARVRIVGDADETLPFMLEDGITETTAAVLYCPASIYRRGSLPLQDVVRIAHARGIPVIVDAAAQLPPRENLWAFTQAGADMAVFSGGKTLCGPQTSGLIVGTRAMIDRCIRFGAPMHGICRSAKASRESMIGLCAAIESYMAQDAQQEKARLGAMVDRLVEVMRRYPIYSPYRVEQGSVGQDYPRAFAHLECGVTAKEMATYMRSRRIFIGTDERENTLYISPLNLTEEECGEVCAALADAGARWTGDAVL